MSETPSGGLIRLRLSDRQEDGDGQILEFRQQEVTIGRAEWNDISLRHSNASRRHCRLYFVDGVLHIEDGGSSNGTFVNGRSVHRDPFREGDRLVIGNFELTCLGPA